MERRGDCYIFFFLLHFPAPRSRCNLFSFSFFFILCSFNYTLGAFFQSSIILIRRSNSSTFFHLARLRYYKAKHKDCQAAFVRSLSLPDIISNVIPSLFRLSIRTLYLSLFLSCLVIPNNSRKSKVTSFLYSFP